ncbi:hypothetical protein GCM10018790_56340 [Kitasatospora xanthocidica]|nr:hypothetical protein GCM10018790_56340 [Kitasatospora xanthocidica]
MVRRSRRGRHERRGWLAGAPAVLDLRRAHRGRGTAAVGTAAGQRSVWTPAVWTSAV